MEIERKAFAKLEEWRGSPHRKPLLLLGARQVGKTWLMREFGRRRYDSVAYVNCDAEPLAKSLFVQDYSIDRILLALQAITGVRAVPGRTLIILDEIQEAPRALHSLKYFEEMAGEYHVMAAGSLLGVTLRSEESFPLGKVDMLSLGPLDFEEFLSANGGEALLRVLREGSWEMVETFAQKLSDQLRYYYYVGGMPEVVSRFVASHDLEEVRRLQRAILTAYRYDISKHSSATESVRIGQVLDSLPSQLAKENKRFVYGAVREGSRAKDFEVAIRWLIDAGIVHKVSRVRKIGLPLKFYEDLSAFKLFLVDCGLLACLSEAPADQMIVGDNVFEEFKGAFTEQYVLQQLAALELPTYYWSEDTSSAEIDFVVQEGSRLLPVEVKAEGNVRARSLGTYLDRHPDPSLKGLRFSMKGYRDQGRMANVPLYGLFKFFAR